MKNRTLLTGLTALTLTACGGGGGSSGDDIQPTTNAPSPPTNVLASGIVTGFGSVFVDAIRYEVESDSVVTIEDELEVSGDDSALRMGMKVRVQATEENNIRTASRIEYDEDLKGPASNVTPDSMEPGTGTLTVLGQMVIVDANTLFDDDVGDNNSDGSIDIRDLTLPVGEVVVEVSGLSYDDGFVATRIDRVSAAAGIPGVEGDEYEIKGFVDSVAPAGSSFTINDTTFAVVEGAGGTEFDDGLQPDASLIGVFVEVKADQDADGNLIAVRVEREDDFGDRNGDGRFDDDDRDGRFEIKGILVSVDTTTTPHTVVIGGTTLRITDASSLSGLQGTLIELKGAFNDDGALILGEAHPENENSIRTEDRISEVDATMGTFITRLGLTIKPEGGSLLEDDVDDGDDHLTPAQFLGRLQIGDYIEARGFPDSSGNVTWRRIEREDEGELECRLRGPVETIEGTDASDFSFVVLGVSIDVSQLGDGDFENASDKPMGRQAFFDRLDVGDTVQAQSDDDGIGCESGRLTAREAEFEPDDGIVGSVHGDDDEAGNTGGQQLTGTPANVSASDFDLNGTGISVVGSTLIDDSIIERALGREFDGDDRRFDQVPEGLSLPEMLTGAFPVVVRVNSDNVALEIEDL